MLQHGQTVDSLHTKYPEWANLEGRKANEWLPAAGGGQESG